MREGRALDKGNQIGRGVEIYKMAAFRLQWRVIRTVSLSGLQTMSLSYVSLRKSSESFIVSLRRLVGGLGHPLAPPPGSMLSLTPFYHCPLTWHSGHHHFRERRICRYLHRLFQCACMHACGHCTHVHLCVHMCGRNQRLTRASSLNALLSTF